MANMCDNSVIFTGSPAAIKNVKTLFKEMQEKQEQTGKWCLPSYVTAPFSYMQDIVVNHEKVTFQTRWYPNFEGLIQIADHFQLDFMMNYYQLTDGISGEASYKNKLFNDNRLDKPRHEHQQNGLSR
jgi:Ferredoxin-like domain in Api92-like protein